LINGLVLSKNRASQLRLLLESIKLNAEGFFNEIKIIYTSSDDDYAKGYEKLISENILDNIVWVKETNFVKNFLDAFEFCETEYICGIVDDCVFYKKIPLDSEQVCRVMADPAIFCFSLRLGLNTYIQNFATQSYDPLWSSSPFPQPRFREAIEANSDYDESMACIKWNWMIRTFESNFGYPISLDGHIYRAETISALSNYFKNGKQGISNLRHWESQLARNIRNMVDEDCTRTGTLVNVAMTSFRQSCLISAANNCVQDPPMTAGTFYPISEKDLNDKYLNNEVLELKGLEPQFQNINSAHTEFDFRFKNI
tara:strand:+ start:576 stop:1511 length:936 start_codon:yes stop_codon:yes gene_type:complete